MVRKKLKDISNKEARKNYLSAGFLI